MFAKAIGRSLAICLVLAPSAPAQTNLVWKLAKGDTLDVERIAAQKQTVESAGKTFKQDRRSTWHIQLKVRDVGADGFRIAALLTKVTHELAGATPAEIIDPNLAEKMQGSSFDLLVAAHGRLVELKGYEDFLKKLSGTDKGRLKALRILFPEETVKEAFADVFGPLLDKAVVKGDAWERRYVEPVPHFGALRTTARYVFEGGTDDRERIAYTLQTFYDLPKDDAGLFLVVKGEIQSEKGRGIVTFDARAGRLVAHERSMLLRGTLTMESMKQRQEIVFTSANEVKIAVQSPK